MDLSFSRIKVGDIDIQLADDAYRKSVGNHIYLVSSIEGLSRDALLQLAYAAPVIVTQIRGQMVPVANARTLALLTTGLDTDTEIPVLIDSSESASQTWRIFDILLKPLLDALDPGSAAAQLDQACLELNRDEIKAVWRGIHTTSGLAEKLCIPKLKIYRSRKLTAETKPKPKTSTD